MHTGQQPRVVVNLHHPLDSLLIERDVCRSGNRHEAERQASLGVQYWLQLPFAPAIVVLRHRQTKRSIGLRLGEFFVAPFTRQKSRTKLVIRLTNHQQLRIAFAFFFYKTRPSALARRRNTPSQFPFISPLPLSSPQPLPRA